VQKQLYKHLTLFHFYNFDYFPKISGRGGEVQGPGLLPASARDMIPQALNLHSSLGEENQVTHLYEVISKIGVL
jgi:hypothetical protein